MSRWLPVDIPGQYNYNKLIKLKGATVSIDILVNLSNLVLANALSAFLNSSGEGYHAVVAPDLVELKRFEPELLLLDPGTLETAIIGRWPAAKIILFDTGLKEQEATNIILTHKLDGIIATNTDTQLFLKALSVIRNGQVWIDNSKLKALLNYTETPAQNNNVDKISRKEQEVIILVAQGFRNREIADKMNISEQTVKAHISNIFRKVNINNRSQLVPFAMNFRYPPMV